VFLENIKLPPHKSAEQDLISEINDRQIRVNNIIIFNLQEGNSNYYLKNDSDCKKILKIFAGIGTTYFKCCFIKYF